MADYVMLNNMSISEISDSLNKLKSFSYEATNKHFNADSGNLAPRILDSITKPHQSLQEVLKVNLETFHRGLEQDQILFKHLSKFGLPTDPQTLLKASATEKPSEGKPFDLLRDLLNYFDNLVRVSSAIFNQGQDFMPTVTEAYNNQIKYLYNKVFVPIINKSQSVLARIFTHDFLSKIPGLKEVLNRLGLDSLPDLDEQSNGFRESPIYSLETVLGLLSDDDNFKKSLADYYFQYQVDPSRFLGSIQFDHAKLVDPSLNPNETAKYLVAKMVMNKDSNGLDSLAREYGFNPVFIGSIDPNKIDFPILESGLADSNFNTNSNLKEQYLPYLKGEKSIKSHSDYTTALVLQAYLRPDKGITIEQLKKLLSTKSKTAN